MALLGGIIFAAASPAFFSTEYCNAAPLLPEKTPDKADRNFIYNLAESIRKNVFIDGWYLNASLAW